MHRQGSELAQAQDDDGCSVVVLVVARGVMVRFNIQEYSSCTSNNLVYFGLMQSFFEQGFAVALSGGDTNKAQKLTSPNFETVFDVLRLFLRLLGGCFSLFFKVLTHLNFYISSDLHSLVL